MRFRDFLRTAVLLFGGAATALAVVSIAGARRRTTSTLVYVALGWWVPRRARPGSGSAARPTTTRGHRALLADARSTNALPELEPGAILFNRLWPLARVHGRLRARSASCSRRCRRSRPATRCSWRSLWRKQSAAVEAIEGRDGVRFWFDRSSPFGPPKLLRLPGLRKIEPDDPTPGASPRRG